MDRAYVDSFKDEIALMEFADVAKVIASLKVNLDIVIRSLSNPEQKYFIRDDDTHLYFGISEEDGQHLAEKERDYVLDVLKAAHMRASQTAQIEAESFKLSLQANAETSRE